MTSLAITAKLSPSARFVLGLKMQPKLISSTVTSSKIHFSPLQIKRSQKMLPLMSTSGVDKQSQYLMVLQIF
eukprot:JP441661.1.p2 GENE.JP441661.1~~JP441661.1.p2  ORF type:complete len:72 (+),score=4.89 JP441661.1:3-218(+)